jgi:hypothetical protein
MGKEYGVSDADTHFYFVTKIWITLALNQVMGPETSAVWPCLTAIPVFSNYISLPANRQYKIGPEKRCGSPNLTESCELRSRTVEEAEIWELVPFYRTRI